MGMEMSDGRCLDADELDKCVFCKIMRKEIPAQFVYEDEKLVAFLDISPVNPGHTLVVPKEHYRNMYDTPDELFAHAMVKVKKIADAIVRATKSNGTNIGINNGAAAGQVVFHTHIHIIPRLAADGLKHWPHKQLPKEDMDKVQEEIKVYLPG